MIGYMPLIQSEFAITRDVSDHARAVKNAMDAVQDDSWIPAAVQQPDAGHHHESEFDLNAGMIEYTDEEEIATEEELEPDIHMYHLP